MSKVKVLGSGFEMISMNNRFFIKSVPLELTKDHTELLTVAQEQGGTVGTVKDACAKLNWTEDRAHTALLTLLKEGLAWIDDQYVPDSQKQINSGSGGNLFQRAWWFPGLSQT